MNFQDYSQKAISTLTSDHAYGDISADLMAQILGLAGESGEVMEKFKKLIRDKQGKLNDDDRAEIIKELGDVLWYINSAAHLLGSSLEEVARLNNEKLASRQQRGQLRQKFVVASGLAFGLRGKMVHIVVSSLIRPKGCLPSGCRTKRRMIRGKRRRVTAAGRKAV